MIFLDGSPYPSVKALLLSFAGEPTCRYRLLVNGAKVAIHGAKVKEMLRTIPKDFEAHFSDSGRLEIRWTRGPGLRGGLLLHALGSIDLGPEAKLALAYCAAGVGEKHFRLTSMPDSQWNAVRGIFGPKKYADRFTAEDSVSAITEYGWRNYVDVGLEVEK